MAAYFSALSPGDRILGMKLAQGGHLTHGMALNFSGRLYEVHGYGVRQRRPSGSTTTRSSRRPRRSGPKLIVGGASAYPRIIDFDRMADIAHAVGALLFVDMAHIAGLVAAGLHPSPFPHADIVTTTTHKTLRGARGGLIFGRRELPPTVDPADFPMVKGRTSRRRSTRASSRASRAARSMHVIAGKAVGFKLALTDEFRRVPAPGPGQRRGRSPRPCRRGHAAGLGRHRQPPDPGRRDLVRGHRQGGRAPPRRDRDHRQQERHPVRPAPAEHVVRYPARHAGHDHAAASARTRCATIGRIIVEAIRRRDDPPPRLASPPRSPRSSPGSRSPASAEV